MNMRFLLTILTFMSCVNGIHIIKQYKLQETEKMVDTELSHRTNAMAMVALPPFGGAYNEQQDYFIPDAPLLFYAGGIGGAILPAGNYPGANIPNAGSFGNFNLVMHNLPAGGAGAPNSCVVGAVQQHQRCDQYHNGGADQMGMYIWGTANPVWNGGAGRWECPGAGAVRDRYVGKAGGGVRGRCTDYNPGTAAAPVVLTRQNIGDQQNPNFGAALTACQCIYQKFYTYQNTIFPYDIVHSGGAVPNPFVPYAGGRVPRGAPARHWRNNPGVQAFITAQESVFINTRDNPGTPHRAWHYDWNVAGRIGPL